MNDEIKLILDYLELYKNLEEGLLPAKDRKLLDYITNLQKTNKNHSKKLIELGDKITNLQQDNEILAKRIYELKNIKDKKFYNLKQENERLKNDLENEVADNKLRWQEYNFFKNKYIEERTKNAQAIEYVKRFTSNYDKCEFDGWANPDILLNILQKGSDDND